MQTTVSPTSADGGGGDGINYVDDSLVEQIWHELGGQVTREQIHQIAAETAAEFRTATVTAFVPVFIRRRTLKKLQMLIDARGSR